MSANLVSVIVALTQGASIPTQTGAAYANTSVVVTDSSGAAQPAVLLNGTETPVPWAFSTSVAPGAGTVVATDLDVNGATLGTPISQPFTEVGTGPSGPTFTPTSGITVTPVQTAQAQALSKKAGLKA
jgi:hypothetical protein